MRLLLASLILATIFATVLSADEGHSLTSKATNTTPASGTTSSADLFDKQIAISWKHTADWNPFSTNDLFYEVWHNGIFLTALDDNNITLSVRNYPELESGCIQIRAVIGEEQSGLSDETCYEIVAGNSNLTIKKPHTSEKSNNVKKRKLAIRRKRREA